MIANHRFLICHISLLQENGPGVVFYRYQANSPTAGSTISAIATLKETVA
jgi:hypothetical protein